MVDPDTSDPIPDGTAFEVSTAPDGTELPLHTYAFVVVEGGPADLSNYDIVGIEATVQIEGDDTQAVLIYVSTDTAAEVFDQAAIYDWDGGWDVTTPVTFTVSRFGDLAVPADGSVPDPTASYKLSRFPSERWNPTEQMRLQMKLYEDSGDAATDNITIVSMRAMLAYSPLSQLHPLVGNDVIDVGPGLSSIGGTFLHHLKLGGQDSVAVLAYNATVDDAVAFGTASSKQLGYFPGAGGPAGYTLTIMVLGVRPDGSTFVGPADLYFNALISLGALTDLIVAAGNGTKLYASTSWPQP